MTQRERQHLRAAALIAVNAFFDALDAAAANHPPRAFTRVPAPPSNDGAPDPLAAKEADRILRAGGKHR
jgi:hypothetical protein